MKNEKFLRPSGMGDRVTLINICLIQYHHQLCDILKVGGRTNAAKRREALPKA
jgi:hypothetical protein